MMPLPSLLFLASALPQTPWRKTALPERLRAVRNVEQPDSLDLQTLLVILIAAGLSAAAGLWWQRKRQQARLETDRKNREESEKRRLEAKAKESHEKARYVLGEEVGRRLVAEARSFDRLMELRPGDPLWLLGRAPGSPILEGQYQRGFAAEVVLSSRDPIPETFPEQVLLAVREPEGDISLYPAHREPAEEQDGALSMVARSDPLHPPRRLLHSGRIAVNLAATIMPIVSLADEGVPKRITITELSLADMVVLCSARFPVGSEALVRVSLGHATETIAIRVKVVELAESISGKWTMTLRSVSLSDTGALLLARYEASHVRQLEPAPTSGNVYGSHDHVNAR